MSTQNFKSEIYIPAKTIPIRKDTQSFEERHLSLFEEMQERMDRRRKEWEEEIKERRKAFFKLDPMDSLIGDMRLKDMDLKSMFYDRGNRSSSTTSKTSTTSTTPGKLFQVTFDVKEFKPEEITVKTVEHKLVVEANSHEKIGSKTTTKSFSKTIEIPRQVNPDSLVSSLSTDGILQIEAPVSAPDYKEIMSTKQQQQQSALRSSVGSEGSPISGRKGTWQLIDNKFKLFVDVSEGYAMEDIKVTTEGKKLKIKGRHEEKSAKGCRSMEFNREVDLPTNSNSDTIAAFMNDKNQLVIEVDLKN